MRSPILRCVMALAIAFLSLSLCATRGEAAASRPVTPTTTITTLPANDMILPGPPTEKTLLVGRAMTLTSGVFGILLGTVCMRLAPRLNAGDQSARQSESVSLFGLLGIAWGAIGIPWTLIAITGVDPLMGFAALFMSVSKVVAGFITASGALEDHGLMKQETAARLVSFRLPAGAWCVAMGLLGIALSVLA